MSMGQQPQYFGISHVDVPPRWGNPRASSIVGVVLLVLSSLVWLFQLSESGGYGRFATDNAHGATANATEDIARRIHIIGPGEFLIAGLILLTLGRLGIIIDRLERPTEPPRQTQ